MDALGLHGGWRFIDLWFEGTKLEICISGSISGGGLFIVSSGLGNGDMGPYGTKLACWGSLLGSSSGPCESKELCLNPFRASRVGIWRRSAQKWEVLGGAR